MFRSVLIANRGEIAVRITRTVRRMGIRSVVVASVPDRRSLAVRSADESVLLEGYSAAETYLDIPAVIAAAKATGCDAIHPGYGFLSERADFAEACAAAGIVFVGPPPAVLRGVGDKAAARQLALANDVPVVPGWDGADDDETLIREATRIGYPVMLKARGGGGGRGMRAVHEPAALEEAIDSARREATSAFGDPGLLLEKLVTSAHHVEVQVLADTYGNVIHLGERDCSVQRRHQKLIEETPSPVVDPALRERLTSAALRLARAIGYVNAGTFEFLVGEPGPDGVRPFYFLEVNPRLQVEHPVTEMVTGLDLVELQLRIAAGEPLPLRQEDVQFSGHAIEFRINAEDPWDNFKPSTGRNLESELGASFARTDTGYSRGDPVPSQYDSLLAKVILLAPTRREALDEALAAFGRRSLAGLPTNVGLHAAILRAPAFLDGRTTVDWLEQSLTELLTAGRVPPALWAAGAAALAVRSGGSSWLGPGSSSVWLSDDTSTREITFQLRSDGSVCCAFDGLSFIAHIDRWHRDQVRVALEGEPGEFQAYMRHNHSVALYVDEDQREYWYLRVVPPPPLPRRAHTAEEGVTDIFAPLAGTIAAVRVEEGQAVEPGDLLLVLEAMKMEHRITAPTAGVVKRLPVCERDVVREGDLLVELA